MLCWQLLIWLTKRHWARCKLLNNTFYCKSNIATGQMTIWLQKSDYKEECLAYPVQKFVWRGWRKTDNQSRNCCLTTESRSGHVTNARQTLQVGQDRSSAKQFQKGLLFVLLICTDQRLALSLLHLWALGFRALNTLVMWLYRYSFYDFRVFVIKKLHVKLRSVLNRCVQFNSRF
jgi:hypothetical protein